MNLIHLSNDAEGAMNQIANALVKLARAERYRDEDDLNDDSMANLLTHEAVAKLSQGHHLIECLADELARLRRDEDPYPGRPAIVEVLRAAKVPDELLVSFRGLRVDGGERLDSAAWLEISHEFASTWKLLQGHARPQETVQ